MVELDPEQETEMVQTAFWFCGASRSAASLVMACADVTLSLTQIAAKSRRSPSEGTSDYSGPA